MASYSSFVELAATPAEVFDFVIRPTNISAISPKTSGLKFVQAPDAYALGTTVEFELIQFGQVQRVTHKVTRFDRPDLFVEEMTKGPLSHWVYTHKFEPLPGGGTLATDQIEFTPPGGLVGLLITEAKILDLLEAGFDYRYDRLEQHFGKA